MKHLLPFLGAALLAAGHAGAAVISQSFTTSVTTAIPDGDLSGVVQTITPSTLITTLDSVTVSLETTGGWNGDLYAYLWHNGRISILLNRTGRTAGDPAGSPTSGTRVFVLSDAAATDVHTAPGGFGSFLTGSYQPSGRDVNPLTALDTSPRTATLSVFAGEPAAGEYRLFIADAATGDAATLDSWSITLTGQAIPEPGSAALGIFAAAALLRRKRHLGGI